MNKKYKRGFGPLIVVIAIAVIAAIGGGGYYVSTKNDAKVEGEANVEVNTSASPSPQTGQSGTLRTLLSLNKDLMCTVSASNAQGESSGVVYISGTEMRGDFTMKSSNGSSIESHMIRSGDTVHAWTGSQGAKLTIDSMNSTDASANANANSTVNLDQQVNYSCNDWNKDASKFTIPSTVNFVDVSAMLKAQGGINVNSAIQGTVR